MKKAWRPAKNNPSPNLHVLLQGEARELYWNWRIKVRNDDPARLVWLKACLMRCDKMYGAGDGEKVRDYMTQFKHEIEGVEQTSPA